MGRRIFYIFVVLNLLILNGLVGYRFYNDLKNPDNTAEIVETNNALNQPEINVNQSCSDSCLSYVDEKIAQITPTTEKVIEKEVVVTQPPIQAVVASQKTKSVSYLPVPGSGNTLQTDWTDIEGTDFYLSKVDYPGITEVYFEANMKLLNGNGKGYLRLYDVTNGRAVDGSTIETSSQTSEFVSSGQIALWEGYNHYKVQAKSLTADTTYFESGRLKIISYN